MDKIENKKILKYILIGIATWLTIESFSVIIKQIATFTLVTLEFKESIIFFTTQILILLSVFLVSRIALRYIIKNSVDLKSLLIKVLVIYIITEIFKFASYLTTPILTQSAGNTSINYFTELKENTSYKTIQFAIVYLKILIVGLTIFFYPNKIIKNKTIEA
jgi:hypothetical protein